MCDFCYSHAKVKLLSCIFLMHLNLVSENLNNRWDKTWFITVLIATNVNKIKMYRFWDSQLPDLQIYNP